MSGIRMIDETQLTEQERRVIQNGDTLYGGQMTVDMMGNKLLLCLLETMQEMKEEIKQLRQTNQRMETMMRSIVTYNNSVRVTKTSG